MPSRSRSSRAGSAAGAAPTSCTCPPASIGPDRRYVMAISSLDPTSAAAARENMTQAVKTMFPGGKI